MYILKLGSYCIFCFITQVFSYSAMYDKTFAGVVLIDHVEELSDQMIMYDLFYRAVDYNFFGDV